MPLALNDPRWSELKGSYGNCSKVIAWLADAYQRPGFTDEGLGNLINEVQHQGDTSTAAHAVAPHLIAIANLLSGPEALLLLIHAGLIYTNADAPTAKPCAEFLKDEFQTKAKEGADRLAPLLVIAPDFETYKWAVAALAGFLGYDAFGRFLDGLDYYEGQFYHGAIDQPISPDI
jgi:hypothetical protein